MNFSPSHLRRYKDVAALFLKYGSKDLVAQTGFSGDDIDPEALEKADDLAKDLERLGPAFVKIGQLLSTRSDLLPPVYLKALSRLQDDVSPIPWEDVEKTLTEELGIRPSRAFDQIDSSPLSSASLGQVHRARLRSGREVAVKVQRPGIRQEILTDVESLAELAGWLDEHTDFGKKYETSRLVAHFRRSILRELDYQLEATHLRKLRQNLAAFDSLVIPEPISDFTTSRVLTMDFVPGTKLTSLSGAVMNDIDGSALADDLLKAYLRQVLVDGFFHADPHPGNILLTPDHRLGIIDLGMVGRLQSGIRDQLVHLLAGISEGDGLETAEAALSMATPRDDMEIDRREFIRRIEDIVSTADGSNLASVQMGSIVMEVSVVCADCGLRVPEEISMLGKTLLNLDSIGLALSPRFNPRASIRKHLTGLSEERAGATLRSSNIVGMLTEVKHLFEKLPGRLNRLSDMVLDNKIRVKVDAIDEESLLQAIQKIANRITAGLLLAALIVGSALLIRVETSFRIFGYPGLAMVFFLLASVGSVILLSQIFFRDK